ncbi:hypothetical protein [Pseudomonas fontis]|uniref:Uncharacterized protein n=1 Tax=Pseudomonas fontis TaxID=2942633 RepID=A0ABT5NSF2_9PSED|nr:hypothetical protein [Pseudomonas fontis]MDD0974819.1 hypothetical protein [Pseudomonas fontis]MDD0991084.1 hypothetical protein [Pseudomonas fontis]
MIYSLRVSEKYEVEICIYFFQCAIDANNWPAALDQLAMLGGIVQKAIAAGRLDNDAKEIILFVATFPDLLQKAKVLWEGLDDLVIKADGQKPYGARVAEVIRMSYIK